MLVPYDTIFNPCAPWFADGLGDKIILFIPIATKSRFFSQSIGADIQLKQPVGFQEKYAIASLYRNQMRSLWNILRSDLHFLAKRCKNTMIEDLNDGYQ